MKLIPLTQGQFAKVDDADFESLSKFKWCASWCARLGSFYALRGIWKNANGKQGTVKMHRFLMSGDSEAIDHINHDTLDNRRENLRACSQSQNMFNRSRLPKNNTSGICGVKYSESRKKWITRINAYGKGITIGYFLTCEEAVAARSEASKKYHGEFRAGAVNV